MAAPTKLTETLVQAIEGRAAAIATRPVADGELTPAGEDWSGPGGAEVRQPVSDPLGWVARGVAGQPVDRRTVIRWELQARSAATREAEGATLDKREELLVRFASALDALRSAGSTRIGDHMVSIALQSGDKTSAVAAAKMLLPRIDPVGWGAAALQVDLHVDKSATKIEELPQSVIDQLTADELKELLAAEQASTTAQARIAAIVERVRRG